MTRHAPIRVLHVVGGMNRGGVETWLMHVLRRVDRQQFEMDFLVHTTVACAFDEEIRALGSSVIPCVNPSQPRSYARALRETLSKRAPYDVIHSHVHYFSGFVLRLASQMGVPMRIAHSHNDTASVNAQGDLRRQFYLALMRRWIARYATDGLAASRRAATALFGRSWEADPRYRILHCSIDLDSFRQPLDRRGMKATLDVPADAFVVGHVGRFDPQKNHEFLALIAAELVRFEPRSRIVLVGDGPLCPAIRASLREFGIEDRVLFLGMRTDVANLMRGVFDVFLFPSRYEGLGLVLVEAQAAGLPCVLTDSLPDEAQIAPWLMRRLPLDEPPSVWAEEVLTAGKQVSKPNEALSAVLNSPFNIEHGLAALEGVYLGSHQGRSPTAVVAAG